MNTPSQEAMILAEAICDTLEKPWNYTTVALLIDERLRLPQCTAALLLAQGVCDVYDRNVPLLKTCIGELRDALAAIKR